MWQYFETLIYLKWFESYSTARSQYVVFDGEASETNGVKCGVPQGTMTLLIISTLGPLLYILSVNDICNVCPLLLKILHADDTCVLVSGNDLKALIKMLNDELISLGLKPIIIISCHQTVFFHLSAHSLPVSLNSRRSSKVQGRVRSEHCNKCAVFSVASPHTHVVSPS